MSNTHYFICIFHFYHLFYPHLFFFSIYFIVKYKTHLLFLWSNLAFIQHSQFSLLTSTIQSLNPFLWITLVIHYGGRNYFIVRLTPIFFLSDQIYHLSNIHNFHCSLLPFNLYTPFFSLWQIYRLFNSHHFICIFHFYHTFYAHLFFFHYKLLHPSFFCLIKSTICPMCAVFLTHFYYSFFTLEIYCFSNTHYDHFSI